MKLRKLIGRSLVGLIAAQSLVLGLNAQAATSTATVQFQAPGDNADAPPVLDPRDPSDPYEPTPPELPVTGNQGPLTLDYVSALEFGEKTISAGTETYASTTLNPFIQVTDRRGTGEGWEVRAVMSEFNGEKGESLPGTTLTLSNGSVVTQIIDIDGEPEPNDPIVLNAGGEQARVVTAGVNQGLGSWLTRWFPTLEAESGSNDSVVLEVPAGRATLGSHTAEITWTLYNAPGGETEVVETDTGGL